ncbi:MAG TPA: hypothetical protein P5201_12465, partial [Aminobacteriaceae bacterium]|nr:hypothetical protein [Aminobacteriaceae bacterium]
ALVYCEEAGNAARNRLRSWNWNVAEVPRSLRIRKETGASVSKLLKNYQCFASQRKYVKGQRKCHL